MVDVIEAAFQVGIQDILGLVIDDGVDCFNSILTGASWAKAIAISLELTFPCRFKRELYESLMRPVFHDGGRKP